MSFDSSAAITIDAKLDEDKEKGSNIDDIVVNMSLGNMANVVSNYVQLCSKDQGCRKFTKITYQGTPLKANEVF